MTPGILALAGSRVQPAETDRADQTPQRRNLIGVVSGDRIPAHRELRDGPAGQAIRAIVAFESSTPNAPDAVTDSCLSTRR